MVKCEPCDKLFIDQSTYKDHVRYSHTNIRKTECPQCNKMFDTQKRMRVHMLRHSKIPQYECDECKKKFIQKEELRVHIRQHSKERRYVCDACGITYASNRSLQKHYRIHTSTTTGDGSIFSATSTKQPFNCPLCDQSFAHSSTFQNHLRNKHPTEAQMQWELLFPRICVKCNQFFPTLETIEHHNKIYHENFKCNICLKFLSSIDALNYHKQKHPTKERRFKCEV